MVIGNVGFDAWNLLTGITVEEVVKKLADKYKVETSVCQEEVLRFVQKLDADGFIDFFLQENNFCFSSKSVKNVIRK